MTDGDACICGWILPPDLKVPVFVQCTEHRTEIGFIESRLGEGSLYRFEYTAQAGMDAEIDERLRRGMRTVPDRAPAPRPPRHGR